MNEQLEPLGTDDIATVLGNQQVLLIQQAKTIEKLRQRLRELEVHPGMNGTEPVLEEALSD